MFQTLYRFLRGEHGVTIGFSAILLLMVAGIFVFLSNTSCEPGGGGGCNGSDNPSDMGTSQLVSNQTVNKGGFEPYMSGSSGPYLQGESVERLLGYSGLASVSRMVWTPPVGATNFDFGVGVSPETGGPPFVFLNPPPAFSVSFDQPSLPVGVDSQKLSESLQIQGADGSSSQASLVDEIFRTPQAPVTTRQPVSTSPQLAASQAVEAYHVEMYRYMDEDVMTTAQCQEVFDWLQGDGTFAALRVPIIPSSSGSSFQVPVIYGPDQATRPMMDFTAGYQPVNGIPDVPLEILPGRMTYLENNLPSESGQAWVAMGVSSDTPVTCPAGMDKTGWEFHFSYLLDLVGKAGEIPVYYCYEGNSSPLAEAAVRMMAGPNANSVQSEGITCMGPQDQSLDTDPALEIGNPGVLWNVHPPQGISLEHYLIENSLTPVNLGVTSSLSGVTWAFYRGTDSAPNLAQPITNPWTPSNTFEFFWLVGTVPQGVTAGSYDITITATKAGDPATTAHVNDLVWVGQWAPPGENSFLYLPIILK